MAFALQLGESSKAMNDDYPRADWIFCKSCQHVHKDIIVQCPICATPTTGSGFAYTSAEMAMVNALRVKMETAADAGAMIEGGGE